MHDLSEQLGTVRKLIEQAPDSTLSSLCAALSGDDGQNAPLRAISELVHAENAERSARAAVFDPIASLCAPSHGPAGLTFSSDTPALLWRALKSVSPDKLAEALQASLDPEVDPAPLFDALCREAARGLRERSTPEFATLAKRLNGIEAGAARMAVLLELCPLLRRSLPHLEHWSRNLNGEYDASIRVAFHEALTVSDDAAALMMEALFAHLDDPYHVLRLVSSVMDRPSEHYLAASEMATFGERLMDDIDRRLEALRRFDPNGAVAAGAEIAGAVDVAIHGIAEFEERVVLNRQGPWGARLQAQKRALALGVEARLREVPSAVEAALPVQLARFGPKKLVGTPKTSAPPNPQAVARGEALLTFLHGVRSAAATGGFGALRAKLVEDLTFRLNHYVEDLLEELHAGNGDSERLRAYLDIAAEFVGLVQDTQSAEFVRRRAAAA